ncbi:MAG: hypothetical protein LBR97_05500 [Dysgonamonadaceae bacterium]|jgi:hypothetical protein|nr:hypothetical protein [Dysgonamonadaceae bacterium]
MKKLICLLAIVLFILTSCKVGEGSLSTSRGLENESFLEFVGTASNYLGGVDVDIDGKTTFKAKVHNESDGNSITPKGDRFKGEIYAISTGTHTVTVSYNSTTIYRKQIFVSAQETKKIVLQ